MNITELKKGDIVMIAKETSAYGPVEFIKSMNDYFFFSPLNFDEDEGQGTFLNNFNYIRKDGRKLYIISYLQAAEFTFEKMSKKNFPNPIKISKSKPIIDGFDPKDFKEEPKEKIISQPKTEEKIEKPPLPPPMPSNLPAPGDGRFSGWSG